MATSVIRPLVHLNFYIREFEVHFTYFYRSKDSLCRLSRWHYKAVQSYGEGSNIQYKCMGNRLQHLGTEQYNFSTLCLSVKTGFWLHLLSSSRHLSAWEVATLVFKTATGVWDNLNSEIMHIQTLTEVPSVMTAILQRASALLSPSLVNWLKLGITCADTRLRRHLKIHQISFCPRLSMLDFK